jgi:hypothetical protein
MENTYIRISENITMYILEAFENFNKDLLELKFSEDSKLENYDILYSYSVDKQNYSNPVSKELFEIPNLLTEIFLGIEFRQIRINKYNEISTLYPETNVDWKLKFLDLIEIKYNSLVIDLNEKIKFLKFHDLINQYPRWNFYDNQIVTINRWLSQCNSIAEMYGHSCIYFKTEPVESETIHTFANHVIRNVVAVKKLSVLAPNNELPQDRNVYSEWDMPLQDDFVLHVVKDKFERAFGLNVVPSEKDYLYLPIINKLFRVAAMQPKNGFMGKIGWWEVFLSKYEEDDTVTIADDLKNALGGISEEFDDALDEIEDLEVDDDIKSEIFNQLTTITQDTVKTVEKIQKDTTDEKRIPTQNFTNKLVDSTFYVSLKETEKLREFYDKRLKILSVNPGVNSYPITMYDNSNIEKRTIALQYNLTDYTIKNKANLTINKTFEFSFNFVLMQRFVGELFDLLSNNGLLSNLTIKLARNKLELIDNQTQQTFQTNFVFTEKEIYNILLIKNLDTKTISIKIFSLINKEKTLSFQDVYMLDSNFISGSFDLTHIHLFGGHYLSSEICLNIDEKNILKDYVNPLIVMKQF